MHWSTFEGVPFLMRSRSRHSQLHSWGIWYFSLLHCAFTSTCLLVQRYDDVTVLLIDFSCLFCDILKRTVRELLACKQEILTTNYSIQRKFSGGEKLSSTQSDNEPSRVGGSKKKDYLGEKTVAFNESGNFNRKLDSLSKLMAEFHVWT